jgi:hypothetical protein
VGTVVSCQSSVCRQESSDGGKCARSEGVSARLPVIADTAPSQPELASGGAVWRGCRSVAAVLEIGVCPHGRGAGRQPGSNAGFRRYLSMAMGSADEARLWCDYSADLEYVPRETSLAWQDELSQIARMLHGLRDSLSEN